MKRYAIGMAMPLLLVACQSGLAENVPGAVSPSCFRIARLFDSSDVAGLKRLVVFEHPFEGNLPNLPENPHTFPDLRGAPLRTFLKARAINLSGNYAMNFNEVGGGIPTSSIFFNAGHSANSVVRAVVHHAQEETEASLNGGRRLKAHVSEESLLKRLRTRRDDETTAEKDRSQFDTIGQNARADKVAADRWKEAKKAYDADPQHHPKPGSVSEYRPILATIANTATTTTSPGRFGRGWVGIRFEVEGPDGMRRINTVRLHVRMLHPDGYKQKDQLGVLGVNLAYAAFKYRDKPKTFLRSLLDDIDRKTFLVDLCEFDGPDLPKDSLSIDFELLKEGDSPYVLFGIDDRSPTPLHLTDDNRELHALAPDQLYGQPVIVVKENMDHTQTPVIETEEFRKAVEDYATTHADFPGLAKLKLISEIKVNRANLDIAQAKEKLLDLKRAGSATVFHTQPLFDLPLAERISKAKAVGVSAVYTFENGKLERLEIPARR